jgi:hypothetical protein
MDSYDGAPADAPARPAGDAANDPQPAVRLPRGLAHLATAENPSLIDAFGGRHGVAEIGIPSLVFVVVYTVSRSLPASLWSALGLAAALTVYRLARRETLQHAISGFVAIAVCAFAAVRTGKAVDFYLPGIWWNLGFAMLWLVSVLVRWPLIGVTLGPIFGENFSWRGVRGRYVAYRNISLLWCAMFVFRVAVEVPLYLAGAVTALGIVKAIVGYPLFALVLYLSWRILRQAPPPLRVAVDEEQEAASPAAERAATPPDPSS